MNMNFISCPEPLTWLSRCNIDLSIPLLIKQIRLPFSVMFLCFIVKENNRKQKKPHPTCTKALSELLDLVRTNKQQQKKPHSIAVFLSNLLTKMPSISLFLDWHFSLLLGAFKELFVIFLNFINYH